MQIKTFLISLGPAQSWLDSARLDWKTKPKRETKMKYSKKMQSTCPLTWLAG